MEAKKDLTTKDTTIELTESSLGERIMRYVPNRETFTGKVMVEIHCKEGKIRDMYLNIRKKL